MHNIIGMTSESDDNGIWINYRHRPDEENNTDSACRYEKCWLCLGVKLHVFVRRAKAIMSAVWTYLTITQADRKDVICNNCRVSVVRGGANPHSFNTTNLIAHLKNHHRDLWAIHEEKRKEKNAPTKTRQKNIIQSFEKAKKFSKTHPKIKAVNRKII